MSKDIDYNQCKRNKDNHLLNIKIVTKHSRNLQFIAK